MPNARSQVLSILIHLVTVAVLLFVASRMATRPPVARPARPFIRLFRPRQERLVHTLDRIARGGGNESRTQPIRGVLPRPAAKTFIAPVRRVNDTPKLVLVSTLADAPPQISTGEIGDPLGRIGGAGLGPGRDGIGAGCCGGAGDESGPGFGSRRRGGITAPTVIYKVEPEFSEEARRAKYQGTVVLRIEVGTDGRPRDMQVVDNPGLGLDIKALEAVAQWRFHPALRAGQPIATTAMIELHFHLM